MNKQKLTKVFIIDDNSEAVELLRNMLEHDYSVEVVGTAGDAETAQDTTSICWRLFVVRLSTIC